MKINITEEQGKKAIKGLIDLTKPKEKPQYKKAEEEVLREVFK